MEGRVYGYCRISTKKQKLQRQIDNIKSAFSGAVIITLNFFRFITSRRLLPLHSVKPAISSSM